MTKKQGNFTLLGGRVVMAPSLYHPTSDAVWLAAFAPTDVKTVLDVGIGTGGVSLCLLTHIPDAQITGIDNSQEMLNACKINADLNNKQITLLNEDITKWSTPDNYDLVITNPPYFIGTPARHNAHHNTDICQWTKKCLARVKPNGYFCTIVDTRLIDRVIAVCSDKHMGDVKIFPLFSKRNTAERVLLRAKKCVRTGATYYKGLSMNNNSILRSGLTVDSLLDSLEKTL